MPTIFLLQLAVLSDFIHMHFEFAFLSVFASKLRRVLMMATIIFTAAVSSDFIHLYFHFVPTDFLLVSEFI